MDAHDSSASIEARKSILEALKTNRARRTAVEADLSTARAELGSLIVAGAERSVSIPEMARVAGIGVETAYLIARNNWSVQRQTDQDRPRPVEVQPLSAQR